MEPKINKRVDIKAIIKQGKIITEQANRNLTLEMDLKRDITMVAMNIQIVVELWKAMVIMLKRSIELQNKKVGPKKKSLKC